MIDNIAPDSHSGKPANVALVAGRRTMRYMGRIVRHLTIGLLDEPVTVTVVAPEGEDLSSLPSPPINLLTYGGGRLALMRGRQVEALASQLSGRGVELLHALDESAHDLTRRISARTGWPYLLWALGLEPEELVPLGPQCRAVLAGSENLVATLRAGQPAKPEMVQVVRPGLHQVREVNCFRRPGLSVSVLAVGSLDDPEPFAAVLESFAEIKQAGYDCVFFVMGSGRAEHRLRERADALGLMHQLTFVDMPVQASRSDILRAADVLVYPQSSGALEMEVLEAMAVGIPTLAGSPCTGDFVIDTQTALRYQAASQADLTGKLKLLMDDHELAARLAQNALRRLRELHSPSRMIREMAASYRQHALSARTLSIP